MSSAGVFQLLMFVASVLKSSAILLYFVGI
eukprot:COSAG02_NODE_1946_length_10302_cov_13.656768_1_plen_29_part_10